MGESEVNYLEKLDDYIQSTVPDLSECKREKYSDTVMEEDYLSIVFTENHQRIIAMSEELTTIKVVDDGGLSQSDFWAGICEASSTPLVVLDGDGDIMVCSPILKDFLKVCVECDIELRFSKTLNSYRMRDRNREVMLKGGLVIGNGGWVIARSVIKEKRGAKKMVISRENAWDFIKESKNEVEVKQNVCSTVYTLLRELGLSPRVSQDGTYVRFSADDIVNISIIRINDEIQVRVKVGLGNGKHYDEIPFHVAIDRTLLMEGKKRYLKNIYKELRFFARLISG